jgi:hypothetical protein
MALARKEKAGGMNHGETRPILILNTRRKSTPSNLDEKKPGRKSLTTDALAVALRYKKDSSGEVQPIPGNSLLPKKSHRLLYIAPVLTRETISNLL